MRSSGTVRLTASVLGPFGVHSSLRGKGVGTALITKAMLQAKSKGTRHLWLAWTGAVDFYSQKAGFKVIRTNRIMRKQLEG
jgi:predicted N-acetyltransferase YhbS